MRSARHYWALFAGAFVALALGVALIGTTAVALAATWGAHRPSAGPAVTLQDGAGARHTLSGGAVDLGGVQSVLAMAGVVSAFVTVFVIAGTFAFSVALRGRDMGLLRLVGAGGPQVRRMVLGEALAVAVPAAAVGCAMGAVVAPWAVRALNGTGLTPVELRAGPLGGPLLFAAGSGLVIAVLGALAAARRAARVRPTASLREADLDAKAMTAGRWISGLVLLTAGGTMVALAPNAGAEAATPLALFGPLALTLAATAWGPLYLPGLVRLLTAPLTWSGSVSGRLAGEAAGTAKRRTAALVGPVLAIVAIVGTFTSVMATTGAAAAADERARTLGQVVVEPADGSGKLSERALAALRGDPRVRAVSAPAPVELAVAGRDTAWREQAAAADLPALARTHRLTAVQGAVQELAPRTVAVSREFADWYGYRVGSRITYGFFGGQPVSARVLAVLDGGAAVPHLLLPEAERARAAAPERATVLLADPSGGAGAAAGRLAAALREQGGQSVAVTPTAEWYEGRATEQDRLNDLVLVVLTGPAAAYALIAVANTLVMSYSRRGREIAGMRMLGAGAWQVRRMALWEALGTTTVGAGLAAGVIALGLAAYRAGLRVSYGAIPLSVPWGALLGLVCACLLVAVCVSLTAVQRLLRRSTVAAVTARE
ncbi:ABC transporter permease [Streptomyces halobius]|uniref:ABC transporter permease n=1 Tax=Streptomyces halobius TaxID=2879846 RepID=UPI0024B195E4|nr:ABC transporter permease [Streptomyces halobius]